MTTETKSIELAEQINSIKLLLYGVDIDYAKECVTEMKSQASWEDSAAVLNPMYNPEKSNLIRKQADMLNHLVQFLEAGKEVDEMKKSVNKYAQHQQNIMKMFM